MRCWANLELFTSSTDTGIFPFKNKISALITVADYRHLQKKCFTRRNSALA